MEDPVFSLFSFPRETGEQLKINRRVIQSDSSPGKFGLLTVWKVDCRGENQLG